jgi:hypothetical protein
MTNNNDNTLIFDNPLAREFLTLEQVARFLGYSPAWIMQQVAEGRLVCHPVGKKRTLFYLDEIRSAILRNDLALKGDHL